MPYRLKNVVLIDDNKTDNFFHERVIKRFDNTINVKSILSAEEALQDLASSAPNELPDLIFLDINMPGMNGWEFLQEYARLRNESIKCIIIVMLSTSENPEDKANAMEQGIATEYKSKPLTKEILTEISNKYKFDLHPKI
jgi:CheY-like chemotaxis protein